MQTAELKEYLGMCVDLEKQVYTQDRMVATLKNNISSMNGEKTVYQVPEEEINDQTWGKWFLHSLPFIVIVAIGIYVGIYFMERGGPFIGLMMWGGGAVFAWLDTVFVRFPPSAEEKMQAKKEYDDALVEYCKATDEEEKRVARQLRKRALLQSQLKSLQAANRQTKENLQKLYNYNIIHPKYRGLIPVCSLYGYFDTGVCTQLEGHEGAYNKYDTESRLDYIICQLDEVIRHLEDIKNNQYQLYAAIKESNRKYDKLIQNTQNVMNQLNGIQAQGAELNSRIAQLQTTSDLTLYENACSHQELSYLHRMAEWGY